VRRPRLGLPDRLPAPSGAFATGATAIWWILVAGCAAEILWLLSPGSFHPGHALLALPPLGAGYILKRQSAGEPVATLLSFAFVLMGALIPRFAPGPDFGLEIIGGACIAFVTAAFAAFPDGRYVPRWTRWSMVVVPLAAAALLVPRLQDGALVLLASLLLVSMALLMARLRRTPVGAERQQLKWAAFGFVAGLAMFTLGFLLGSVALEARGALWAPWLHSAGQLLILGGILMMPLGVIISMLRFRLNDIDAVVGRSSSFAAAAALVALLWASGLALIETTAARLLGGENSALPKVIVALAAMALFAPSQKKVMHWTEARLRPAFVRLRSLPARLAQWQHGENPCMVAQGALAMIVDGIKAERAALVAVGDDGRRILATHELEAETADKAIPDSEGSVEGFPLVLALNDDRGRVGTIFLGPRSDGATYRRDEREAVQLVVAPLADALRATTDCERRTAALDAQIVRLTERVRQLEAREPKAPVQLSGPTGQENIMTDDKKKGDFDQWQREDKGGDEKQRDNRNENSRTGSQNSGGGGRD
jgi:hypothetical protein